MSRWLLPVAALLTLGGYFGPWVDHRAAGLVITGLDMGEYVKFLPPVRAGDVWLWRPGFYAPLVAVAATCALIAYRRALAYPFWARLGLLALAGIAALNLLPPAWTPARLLEPEFRVQTGALVTLLVSVASSPVFAHVPALVVRSAVAILAVAAIGYPVQGCLATLPTIAILYGHPLQPAWGLWLTGIGLVLLMIAVWRMPTTAQPTR